MTMPARLLLLCALAVACTRKAPPPPPVPAALHDRMAQTPQLGTMAGDAFALAGSVGVIVTGGQGYHGDALLMYNAAHDAGYLVRDGMLYAYNGSHGEVRFDQPPSDPDAELCDLLGPPVADQRKVDGGSVQSFEHGELHWLRARPKELRVVLTPDAG